MVTCPNAEPCLSNVTTLSTFPTLIGLVPLTNHTAANLATYATQIYTAQLCNASFRNGVDPRQRSTCPPLVPIPVTQPCAAMAPTTYRRHPSLEIGKNDITPLSHTSTSWPLVDLADHLVGIPYFKLLKTCMIPTALNHSLFSTSPSHPPPWSPTRDLLA